MFVKVSSSWNILLLILRTSYNQMIWVRLQGLLCSGLYNVDEYTDIPRPLLSRDNTRDKTRFTFIGVPGFGWHLTCSHLPRDNKLSTNPHRQHTVRQLSTLTHSTEVKIQQSYMVLGLLSWKPLDLDFRHTVCHCSNISSTISWYKYFFSMTGFFIKIAYFYFSFWN